MTRLATAWQISASTLGPPTAPLHETGDVLINAFLRGRSPRTVEAYSRDLEAFRAYAGADALGAAITALITAPQGEANRLALGYRDSMIDRGLSPATVNRRLAALRSAVKLARMLGMTGNTIEVPGVRCEAYRDVRGPGVTGMQALLDAARQRVGPGSTRDRALRDVAALRLTFDLALRRAELLSLRLSDLDGDRIWLLRKGRRDRVAKTLPVETLKALGAWLKARDRYSPTHEFVFIGLSNRSQGLPLTADGWYAIVGEVASAVGLRVHPHAIRHASITAAAIATGGNMVDVQEHSGHANIATARRYVAAARDTAGRVASMVAERIV